MEPDGKTRLYYYHVDPVRVIETANKDISLDSPWTTGSKALEIYQRADFLCINVRYSDGRKNDHIWAVRIPGQGPDKGFKIIRTHGYTDQDYLDLIRKLERRTHKKGLTVLVS